MTLMVAEQAATTFASEESAEAAGFAADEAAISFAYRAPNISSIIITGYPFGLPTGGRLIEYVHVTLHYKLKYSTNS